MSKLGYQRVSGIQLVTDLYFHISSLVYPYQLEFTEGPRYRGSYSIGLSPDSYNEPLLHGGILLVGPFCQFNYSPVMMGPVILYDPTSKLFDNVFYSNAKRL